MKKIWLSIVLSFVLLLSACGTNYEKQLVATWYREGASSPAFVLYDDGTCEIAGEYGTGSWAIVNDNQFKLTNFYGESESATIVRVDKESFVISGGNDKVTFFKEPAENRETQSDSAQTYDGQGEVKTEEALCRSTFYTDGVEDGFRDSIEIFNENGYLLEEKELDEEGKVSSFSQWEYDEFGNGNGWVRYAVHDENIEIVDWIEYTDYENIEEGFWRKSESYNCKEEVQMVCEYFYNENHKLVEELRYQDGEVVIRIEYIYDEQDRLAEDLWYYANDEVERNVYFYGQSGKPLYMMQYNKSDELEQTYTWEYDEYGRIISTYWKNTDGRLILKSDYDYKFNE